MLFCKAPPYLKTQNLFKRMSQKTCLYLAIADTKNENSDIAICRRLMADQFIKEIVRQYFFTNSYPQILKEIYK